MPYSTTSDLPPAIQDKYEAPAQRAFLAAFNSVMDETGDEGRAMAAGHSAAQASERKEYSLLASLMRLVTGFFKSKEHDSLALSFKVLDDDQHFIAWYTNPYQDRDKEWIAEAAIEADINAMLEADQFPELWFWHTPQARIGQAQSVIKAGRFAVAFGVFDDTPLAGLIKQAVKRGTYKLSHGFYYAPEDFIDGVYRKIKTFEISVLPAERAANVNTMFAVTKERIDSMAGTPDAIAHLRELAAGTGINVDELLSVGENASKQLDQFISHKAMVEQPEVMVEEQQEDAPPVEMEIEEPEEMSVIGRVEEKLDVLINMLQAGMKEAAPTTEATRLAELEAEVKALKESMEKRTRVMQGFEFMDMLDDYARQGTKDSPDDGVSQGVVRLSNFFGTAGKEQS